MPLAKAKLVTFLIFIAITLVVQGCKELLKKRAAKAQQKIKIDPVTGEVVK